MISWMYGTPDIIKGAAEVPAGDYLAAPDAQMYYVSIDPHGELAWPFNSFDYADVPVHVIEVLSDAASNEYKEFLRRKQISYIIKGDHQIDYQLMICKLYELRNKRLMIGVGGIINWTL